MSSEKKCFGLRQLARGVAELLYPRSCLQCGEALADAQDGLCAQCEARCPAVPNPCPVCALPGGGALLHGKCPSCNTRSLHFASAVAAFQYDGAVQRQLHALKFENRTAILPWMSRALAARVKSQTQWRLDAVVAVPMHPEALAQRGYNQAELLARDVAAQLGVRFEQHALCCARPFPNQYALSVKARFENVKGVYIVPVALKKRVEAKTVLLVDDIMTTGATAAECSRALKQAGARRVHVAVVARTAYGNIGRELSRPPLHFHAEGWPDS